jgi:uncharacterized membrane protein
MDDFDMGLLDDKTYMVSVLRQKMLGIAPVFTYRIKEEKPNGEEYKYVVGTNTNETQVPYLKIEEVALLCYIFSQC